MSTLRDGTGCMDAEHVLVCAGAILEQARKHGLSFNDLVFDVHVHEADVAEITDLELIKVMICFGHGTMFARLYLFKLCIF